MAAERNLDYIEWKDPWAWTETMRGKRWEQLVKEERGHYHMLSRQVEYEAKQMEQEIRDAHQYAECEGFTIGCGTIHIQFTPNTRFLWKWSWKKKAIPAYDIDVQGNIVWYVTSDEDTHSRNLLHCEDTTGKKIWTKKAVSTQIAIIGSRCYYVKVIGDFQTSEFCVCDAHTGGKEHVIYKERNEEYDLQLVKGANRALYLQRSNPVHSQLFRIEEHTLFPLYKGSLLQLPLGESIYGEDCVLLRTKRDDPWRPTGKPVEEWKLPEEEIVWGNLHTGHLLTIKEGAQTLWYCLPKKPAKAIFKIKVGQIHPNVWTAWEGALIQSFMIKSPFRTPFMIHVTNHTVVLAESQMSVERPVRFKPLDVVRYHAVSKDGTRVPYIMVKEKGVAPKALFCYVYGAYGTTTPIQWPYQTWYPLLRRRWAMIFSLVRGGGDSDAEWADAARRENRIRSVEDFEAIIVSAQKRFRLGPEKTVIYGRSAGGVPVGAVVSRHPEGDVAGAAFTEVPYVDVLRTSSNPDLPLTVGEYQEFGNPKDKILNFKALLNVSPVNTVPAYGAPGVFVLTHVGLLDRQVFAYESFKWIQRLRGFHHPDQRDPKDPKGKYVVMEKNEAHVYRIQRLPRFRAMDFAILNAWVEGRLRM